MTISVLMAVRNNEATLAKAIDSILTQTFTDFIFYIIDDCSSDESPRILATYAKNDSRIRLITNQHHLGLTKSLNKALRQIKAPLICRMDADDISLPTRLVKQFQFMTSHQEVALLGTAAYLIDSRGRQVGLKTNPLDHVHIQANILKYCPFIHPTWMIRRQVITEFNGYNNQFPFAQDYELAIRLVAKYETANLPEPLLYYRVNTDAAISLKNLKKQESLALRARFLALTKYGYSKLKFWQLFKPLLSFLVPVVIKKAVYRKFFWSGCLFFSLLIFSGCQKTTPLSSPSPSSSPETALVASPSASPIIVNVERAQDYRNWKYYNNDTYRFKLRHPFNWYFINADQEPGIVTLATVSQDQFNNQVSHAFCQIETSKQKNQSLANFPALLELKAGGREPRQFKIAKMPALFIDKLGSTNDLFSVFVENKDTILRFNFGGNNKVNRDEVEDICLQIIASLEFF